MLMPRLRTKKTEFLLRKTIFYSIFSALLIAVCYIAAQARKCGICTKQLKRSLFLNAVKVIGLQNSKTYFHAAFAQEGNRICIKDNNIL